MCPCCMCVCPCKQLEAQMKRLSKCWVFLLAGTKENIVHEKKKTRKRRKIHQKANNCPFIKTCLGGHYLKSCPVI